MGPVSPAPPHLDLESNKKGHIRSSRLSSANLKAISYGLMNIFSASGIVFANKYVFANCKFHFTYALTWIHTVFTLVGMIIFAKCGMFDVKKLPQMKLVPLAAAYVAYIVLCNLSLNVNTVGYYQVMKIAVAPTVIGMELVMFGKLPPPKTIASVVIVCIGIAVATVTDDKMVRNLFGVFVGLAATLMTALYQIWAGSKQKELRASSMQLLHAYTPQAALMLGLLVPMMEPMGWGQAHAHHPAQPDHAPAAPGTASHPDTLLGYTHTRTSVIAILVSSALGLMVSLSTFLVIGATSSLTYNVVGHLKTLIILTGGCMFFGDEMPPKKLAGVGLAMCGIIWYTQLKLSQSASSSSGAASGGSGPHVHAHATHRSPRSLHSSLEAEAGSPGGAFDGTIGMGGGGSRGDSGGGMSNKLDDTLSSKSVYTTVGLGLNVQRRQGLGSGSG